MEQQSLDDCTSVYNKVYWILSAIVETYCLEKKKSSFKLLLLIDNAPGHQIALMEMYNEMTVVFLPANISAACESRGNNFEVQEFQC